MYPGLPVFLNIHETLKNMERPGYEATSTLLNMTKSVDRSNFGYLALILSVYVHGRQQWNGAWQEDETVTLSSTN